MLVGCWTGSTPPPAVPHNTARAHRHTPATSNDRDGDGIPNDRDKCPDDPEDLDGFQDDDGCPDPDNDNDGVPDVEDQCPNEPGPAAKNGCP